MSLRLVFLLLAVFASLPSFGQQEKIRLTNLGNGTYRFTASGFPKLLPLYPANAGTPPRYELFVELGDGAYKRVSMVNPAGTGSSVDLFTHQYTIRQPDTTKIRVMSYPVYSRTKKPTIPDVVAPVETKMSWVANAAGQGLTQLNYIPPGTMAKGDLHWNFMEADDEFIVLAGYQNDISNVQQPFDLSKGGYVSIYYNSQWVTPVGGGSPRFSCYDNNVTDFNNSSFDPNSDPVILTSGEDINARVDFEVSPLAANQEEFIFANFLVNDGEAIQGVDRFPIVVVVWESNGQNEGPTGNYEPAETIYGEIRTGKDPNEIEGYFWGGSRIRPLNNQSIDDSLTHIDYMLEFYNSGNGAVDQFIIDVDFPDHVLLADYTDVEVLSVRIGGDVVNVGTLTSLPELLDANLGTISWKIKGQGTLVGYADPVIDSNPAFYPYCSAEIWLRVPRNPAKSTCDSIQTSMTITFPDNSSLTRTDTLLCLEGGPTPNPSPTEFPCNIVPDIPFLGGCWCTLLVIVLLAVILLLIMVVARNAAKPKN